MSDRLKGSLGADGKIWCLPCAYYGISSPFGWRNHPYGGYKHHNGVDLTGYHDMPLYATKDGIVTVATYNYSAGNYIIIDHEDGTKSVYMHMGKAVGKYPNKDQAEETRLYSSRWLVKKGDRVIQGQQVGHMGSTGCSTGTHLHFGVQKAGYNHPDSGNYIDPMLYIGGTRCSIVANSAALVPQEYRIQLADYPLSTDWEPDLTGLFSPSNSDLGKSSLQSWNTYRYNLLANINQSLFSSKHCDDLCGGYGVFGLNNSIDKFLISNKPNISKSTFWDIAKDTCGFQTSGVVIKNNLSYIISRVNEVIASMPGENKKSLIIKSTILDWFNYNKTTLHYPFSNLPKVGDIMCWKSTSTPISYKMKFIENVLGTDWISVSEYIDTDNSVSTYLLKNETGNWGEASDYEFEGFIHVLPDLQISQSVNQPIEDLVTSVISYDENNNLVIKVYNTTDIDRYCSIVFSINNMKHINNIRITYDAFINNSSKNYNENKIAFCFSEQIWNCDVIGECLGDTDKEFINNWPSTYFPYKLKYDTKGQFILPEGSEIYKHPYRYNGPFPSGNLLLADTKISADESTATETIKSFDLYSFNNVKCFDSSGDIQRFVRNHMGYFCIIVKAPKINPADFAPFTSTTIKIKEILVEG